MELALNYLQGVRRYSIFLEKWLNNSWQNVPQHNSVTIQWWLIWFDSREAKAIPCKSKSLSSFVCFEWLFLRKLFCCGAAMIHSCDPESRSCGLPVAPWPRGCGFDLKRPQLFFPRTSKSNLLRVSELIKNKPIKRNWIVESKNNQREKEKTFFVG